MTDNVIISIKGKQLYAESSPEEIELVTSGTLKRDSRGGFTISYQESELTGLEGTLTTIHVDGDEVSLMRVGEFNSQMVFREGRRHLSLYNTPYGAMTIGVHTRHLLAELGDQGGELEVDYSVEVDHTVAGRNVFHISVKELEDGHGSLRQ